MHIPILGKEVTIDKLIKYQGSAFLVTGKNCPSVGLPNGFLFQAPDKFAPPVEQSLNQYGQLVNTFPLTQGVYVLAQYLIHWMLNRRQD
jgi:hypothetical protein